MSDQFLFELTESVAWLTLNQPERMNAMSTDMMSGLTEALALIEQAREEGLRIKVGSRTGTSLSQQEFHALVDDALQPSRRR